MIWQFTEEYEFLCNFSWCSVRYRGVDYKTAEHAYQAAKATNAYDRERIARCPTPGNAKSMGQVVERREDWDDVKVEVMYKILKSKFSDPELAKQLLATGDEIMIEGNNWHDNYWGDCFCKHCLKYTGRNTLGDLLSLIRNELREIKWMN